MDMRPTIQIEKIDETYIRVTSEPSVQQELTDYFTFPVPGAKFMPSVRNRYWDGNIRLYSYSDGKLYTGLYYAVQQFAQDREYDIDGYRWETDVEEEKFVENLQLPFEVRDYQTEAITRAITSRRSLLVSPTASGKSLIIYAIAQHFIKIHRKRVLIIVPTTSLVEQMATDFESYGYNKPIDKMYGGNKIGDTEVVVTTWQTLSRMPKSFYDHFGAVFGDEAHLFKAKVLTGILEKMKNISHRWGTTGTLDDSQTHKLVLEGLFGPTHFVTSSADLIDDGTLADLNIQCLVLKKYLN
jgi:superfamily II DNA or RNA helicase